MDQHEKQPSVEEVVDEEMTAELDPEVGCTNEEKPTENQQEVQGVPEMESNRMETATPNLGEMWDAWLEEVQNKLEIPIVTCKTT